MKVEKIISIHLTADEARHLFWNADGWLDAGACDDGLKPDEQAALRKVCEQISKKLKGKLQLAPTTSVSPPQDQTP